MRFTIAILLTITARVANAQISPVNLSQTTDAQKGTFSIEADATIQDLLAKKTEGKHRLGRSDLCTSGRLSASDSQHISPLPVSTLFAVDRLNSLHGRF